MEEKSVKTFKELVAEEYEIGEVMDSIPLKPKKRDADKLNLALDLDGICEVLDAGDKLVYLTNEGKIIDQVETEEGIFVPPPKDSLPYLLARQEDVMKYIGTSSVGSDVSDDGLYIQVRKYHQALSELPNNLYYDLLVLWDIHTYLLEKIHFSPILYFYAVKERGKSRTAKGCIYIARRGIFTETIREPDIIRWGNDHKASVGFDVKDFSKKIQRANCDDLILARFEKGSTSSRTLWPEKGAFKDTKTFKLFGPTIIATNRAVDDILESRCISMTMKPTAQKFENKVLAENALDLKAQLVAFRFAHQGTELIDSGRPVLGRTGDILSPLNDIVLTFFPKRAENFKALIDIIVEQKKEEATDSFDASMVEIVLRAEPFVSGGFLSINQITSLFNEGKDPKFSLDNRTIGRILKSLGFVPRRTGGGERGIYYDPELIKSIGLQYGLVNLEPETEKEGDVGISSTTAQTSLMEEKLDSEQGLDI